MVLNVDWDPFLIVWWPHSGCRWLNRSLLKKHSGIAVTEFVMPFLTVTADAVLSLDRTAQVHKARSLPELAGEFEILRSSVEDGRRHAVASYLVRKQEMLERDFPRRQLGGAFSLGCPEPRYPDLDLLLTVAPSARLIHLVRNPLTCFLSMKSRYEMDGNPHRIGASWAGINASIRQARESLPGSQAILLRYEDLVSDPASQLSRLCAWLGVDFEEDMLDGAAEYHGRNRDVDLLALLTERERHVLQHLVATEAGNYDYEV